MIDCERHNKGWKERGQSRKGGKGGERGAHEPVLPHTTLLSWIAVSRVSMEAKKDGRREPKEDEKTGD